MKKQYLGAFFSVLGLAGCGGGSSGGSDNTGSPVATTNTQVSASALLGTWVQTNVNYADPLSRGELEWVKTRRQTIIVENVAGVFRFRDCNSGNILAATLVNNTVTFPAQPGLSLSVADASTMSTTVTQATSRTEVELHKVSSSKEAVGASVELIAPLERSASSWNQVCVHTIADKYAPNIIELKAVGSENGITGTVALKFQSTVYFTQAQYDYPGLGYENVSGSYSVTLLGSGSLNNPVGSMILMENSTTDLSFSLTMDNSSTPGQPIDVMGEIKLEPEWLSIE